MLCFPVFSISGVLYKGQRGSESWC